MVVVGDLVTDVMVIIERPPATGSDTPARISMTGGGSAANTAAWLAFLGVPVTLLAAVGDDAAGRTLVEELAGAGVTCRVAVHPEAPTGSIVVIADSSERSMLSDRGANLALSPADVVLPDGATHLHLSGYPLLARATRPAGLHALRVARERGLTTSVDAASAALLPGDFLSFVAGVDVLFANADEASVLAGPGPAAELARRLAAAVPYAVVKLGPDGAVCATSDGCLVRVPADPVEVVEPTGAGDAFAAGFLAAWPADLARALREGARLGGLAVARAGARPGHPAR